jgi:hypothetical protein
MTFFHNFYCLLSPCRNRISVQALIQSFLLPALHGPVVSISVTTYTFSLALSACLSTGCLLGWHVFLILTNQVSIFLLLSVCWVMSCPMAYASMFEPTPLFLDTQSFHFAPSQECVSAAALFASIIRRR